jgi:ATPase subunit of ABC transporter with duplicated ATPase domains
MSRLTAANVGVSFGARVVLDGVSVSIGAGDRIGIIAPNEVGKSTLLNVLAGDLEPDAGHVTRSPDTSSLQPSPSRTQSTSGPCTHGPD